jgi:alkaline phosphatase D
MADRIFCACGLRSDMLNRRQLLQSTVATALATFASAHARQQSDAPARKMRLRTDPFALGVASGEPSTDGGVIWTRVVGIETPTVSVSYEIAEDDAFRRIVRSDRVTAVASFAHAVHVPVTGLRPGAEYWYRFRCGDAVSRSGRLRTIPLAPQRLRIALASCQHWEQGFFSAYADMIGRDADVVVHVGDYIYEASFGSGTVRQFDAPVPRSLEDYRARYALYRSDDQLQNAHAALPFVMTWDDHEVENDYAGSLSAIDPESHDFMKVRAAAYQAWLEHTPLNPASVRGDGNEIRIFRRLSWPQLATLHVLDTRQYRDVQPCSPPDQRRGHRIARCADVEGGKRTMLGARQERWLTEGLAAEQAPWSVVAQQTLFAPMQLPDDTIWSDFWDAYPLSRARMLDALRQPGVRNALVLGGDLHSFWVNDVRAQPQQENSAAIATELLTTCLAGRNGPADLFSSVPALNSHVRYLDFAHSGYQLVDLTPQRVLADLRVVEQPTAAGSRLRSLRQFHVESGRPGAQPA